MEKQPKTEFDITEFVYTLWLSLLLAAGVFGMVTDDVFYHGLSALTIIVPVIVTAHHLGATLHKREKERAIQSFCCFFVTSLLLFFYLLLR